MNLMESLYRCGASRMLAEAIMSGYSMLEAGEGAGGAYGAFERIFALGQRMGMTKDILGADDIPDSPDDLMNDPIMFTESRFKPYADIANSLVSGVDFDDSAYSFGTYTDSRSGKTYRTFVMPTIEWMLDNFDYAYGCEYEMAWHRYVDQESRIHMAYFDNEGASKAIPEGWEVPSLADWKNLIDFAGAGNMDLAWRNLGTMHYGLSFHGAGGGYVDNSEATVFKSGGDGNYLATDGCVTFVKYIRHIDLASASVHPMDDLMFQLRPVRRRVL